jgi:hypothetical protein
METKQTYTSELIEKELIIKDHLHHLRQFLMVAELEGIPQDGLIELETLYTDRLQSVMRAYSSLRFLYNEEFPVSQKEILSAAIDDVSDHKDSSVPLVTPNIVEQKFNCTECNTPTYVFHGCVIEKGQLRYAVCVTCWGGFKADITNKD